MALTKINGDVIEANAISSTHLASGAVTHSSLSSITTDNVSEGSTNLYYSDSSVETYLDGGTSTPTFASATVSGALTVTGDLNITGDINSYNVTDLDVTDQTITLGAGQIEANSGGSGIIVDGSSASLLWDETNTEWDFNNNVHISAANGELKLTSTANSNNNLRLYQGTNSYLIASNNVYMSANSNSDMFNLVNGNVGIGEASPITPLHVKMATGKNILFQDALSSAAIKFTTDAGAGYAAGTINASSLAINADSGGNLAVGGTTPVAKLHVQGTGTSGQVSTSFLLENASSGTAGMDITGAAGSSRLRFLYGGGPSTGTNTLTEALNIVLEGSSAGNVGIGTDNPDQPLTVVGSSTAVAGKFLGEGGPHGLVIGGNDAGFGYLSHVSTGNYDLKIDSSGNVQIGGVNHQNLSGSTKELTIGTTGDTSNDGGGISFTHNSVLGSYILGQKGAMTIAHYIDGSDIIFRTNEGGTNADRVRITGDGGGGALLVGGETSMDAQVLDGTGSAGALYIGNTARSYPVIAMVSQHRKWLSDYVTNDGSLRTYDSVANHETQITDTSGRVTFPKQPHILFSPRYSGGSGFANTHNENTSYSRGTLSTTVVGGYARITVPVAGLYLVTFNTICDSGTGRMDTIIAVNGGAVTTGLNDTNTSGFHYRSHAITLDLAANDYLTFSNDDWYDASANSYTTWRNVSVTLIG